MPPQDEIRHLLQTYQRRLQHLRQQQATFGVYTPPHILIDIEDTTAQIRKLRLELGEAPPTETAEPPYLGLHYFDVSDAGRFFGREQLTAKLVGHLRQHRFLAVVGASGSGKSSVVRAGLIPALVRGQPLADGTQPPDGSERWPIHIITPTAHPLEALAASLTRDSESVTATATLIDDLQQEARSLHLYARKLLAQATDSGQPEHLFLLVDQFEELFTACKNDTERRAFVNNLLTAVAAETGGPTKAVITLRADFYHHCAQYEALRQALAAGQAFIGPMSPAELRQAIERPAGEAGCEFESGLVDLLLRDVGEEPGALPLLSHALLETWRRREGPTLTLQGYQAAGGVQGAIAHTAETVYHQLAPDQQAIARRIFLAVTELGEGTQDTRRRAALEELLPQPADRPEVEAVLNILADARLITTGQSGAEVAHEALIREWPTLHEWLAENREALRLRRQLFGAVREWDQHSRDPAYLYRGLRLSQANELATAQPGELSQLANEFLQASLAEQQRLEREQAEQARRQQQLRQQRWLAVGLGVGLLIFLGLAIFAFRQRSVAIEQSNVAATAAAEAENQRELAEAARTEADGLKLAFAAFSQFETNHELGQLLAVEAGRAADTFEAESALRQALLQRGQTVDLLHGHEDPVLHAAWSPDGQFIVTASADETARVWRATDGTEVAVLTGHEGLVRHSAWSPDGQQVVTASLDGTVRLWRVADGAEVVVLSGHDNGVLHAAWSPDGQLVVTTSVDGTARLWRAVDGVEVAVLSGHESTVWYAAWSSDGQQVVTASGDGTARLWRVADGTAMAVLSGHDNGVLHAAWSPDGQFIVTAAIPVIG